ncbi:hypothetical protein FVQ98_03510 [Ottowia sp. GY511]|uniref:IPTL-CTERM sorting domain-containing protein n=1 Tax=Ottowia flava TaxID=2675430 RepID=A0ABW4KS35_9BURK|nr:hypothetical protein [Ottowia sp. GY511]TXK33063.1 hypothetical protein FVQ98_03510 [Ottowia sp. GY511]
MAVWFTSAAAAQAQHVNETQSFRGAAAPGWTLLGAATLSNNPAGEGWLRLTGSGAGEANIQGGAVFDTPVLATQGVDIRFTYQVDGDADGFTVFAIDGSTASPSLAPSPPFYGHRLGYVGMPGGYVAAGFNEYFGLAYLFHCVPEVSSKPCGGAQTETEQVVALGSVQAGSPPTNTALDWASAVGKIKVPSTRVVHTGRVTLTPAPDVTMTIEIDGTPVLTTPLMVAGQPMPGMAALPATLKFGFSGAFGAWRASHDIRDVTIVSGRAPTAVPTTSLGGLAALAALLTAALAWRRQRG